MIKSNIQELENYLSAMAKRTTNMRPVMGMIGEKIVTMQVKYMQRLISLEIAKGILNKEDICLLQIV